MIDERWRFGDYLAASGSGADYTSNPKRAIDPLPAVDDDVLDELTRRARRLRRLLEMEQTMVRHRQLLSVRLRRARSEAKLKGIDIRKEVYALQRAMEHGRSEHSIERRMSAIERLVWNEDA